MAQVSAAQQHHLLSQMLDLQRYESKKDKITLVDDGVSIKNVTYVGVAKRPAKEDSNVWEITMIDERDSNVDYVDSNIIVLKSDPNVAWTDRLTLNYK